MCLCPENCPALKAAVGALSNYIASFSEALVQLLVSHWEKMLIFPKEEVTKSTVVVSVLKLRNTKKCTQPFNTKSCSLITGMLGTTYIYYNVAVCECNTTVFCLLLLFVSFFLRCTIIPILPADLLCLLYWSDNSSSLCWLMSVKAENLLTLQSVWQLWQIFLYQLMTLLYMCY